MTDVPLRAHLEARIEWLERSVAKTEGGLLARVNKLENQVEELRRSSARLRGQITLATTVVSMTVSAVVSALVAWMVTQWWSA